MSPGKATGVATHQVTALLQEWAGGDEAALGRLIPLVNAELRRLARRYMARERAGHTLQPTALVNEAYLRLVDIRAVRWQDRAHFLAMAARIMRRVLVDGARARGYQKRGGKVPNVTFDETRMAGSDRAASLTALDDALTELAAVDARKAQVIELRFFGGLTVEETAEALKVSPQTVMRDWKLGRTWLVRELDGKPANV